MSLKVKKMTVKLYFSNEKKKEHGVKRKRVAKDIAKHQQITMFLRKKKKVGLWKYFVAVKNKDNDLKKGKKIKAYI